MEKLKGKSGAEVVGYLIGVTAVAIFLPAFVVLMALNVLRAVFFPEIPVLTYWQIFWIVCGIRAVKAIFFK